MAGTHSVPLSPKIYIDFYDFSADMNSHSIGQTCDLKESTCYGDLFKQRQPGLRDAQFGIAGNVDLSGATDQETIMQAKMAVHNVPLIIAPTPTVIGSPCEFAFIDFARYSPRAQHGEIFKFDISGNLATRRWIRGQVLWSPATSITGTSNGTEVNLGAVSASQSLYVAIAVLSHSANGNLIFKIQSDATGFASPTDRVTFATATDKTSEMPTPVAGAITDDFWRAAVTTMTATSATAIVVGGIA